MQITALLIPAIKVPHHGRKLVEGNYQFLVSQLCEGEKLVGLYLRGDFWTAPWLFSDEEHKGFERHVKTGLMQHVGYYAVSQETFEELVVE